MVSCKPAEEANGSNSKFAPEEDRLVTLESNPDEYPLIVMRLLKFKTSDGLKTYEDFLKVSLPLLRAMGGEMLFLGTAAPYELNYESSHALFGLEANPWDLLVLERFPSRKDFRKLGSMEDYQDAESELQGHLESVALHALNGSYNRGRSRSPADTVVAPEFPDGEALYEINLLRFKPNGGEEKYYSEYAREVLPMIADIDAKVVYGLKGELLLVGKERYDRVVLVMYPSEKAFHQMVMSDAYRAVSPHREDALEVGHLFGFRNAGKVLKRLQETN